MSKSPKNINELIASLEKLNKANLNDEYELFWSCQDVFERLKMLSDFNPDDLKGIIKTLRKIPEKNRAKDIKELGIEEVEDKKLESKVPDKKTLEQLIEEHEKATGTKKEEIEKEIYNRTGKKNVDQFIKTQKEIAERNAKKLDELSPNLREKVSQNIAKASNIDQEDVSKIIEEEVFKEKQSEVRELENKLKKYSKEAIKTENTVRQIKEIRAEIVVESKAEEIAKSAYEKLKIDQAPVSPEVEVEIKKAVLESWKEGKRFKEPNELENKNLELVIAEIKSESEKFKGENLEAIVNYRAIEFREEIGSQFRQNGLENEDLINRYTLAFNDFINNPRYSTEESSQEDIVNFVNGIVVDRSPGEVDRARQEADFMRKGVAMPARDFNIALDNYYRVSGEIGNLIGKDNLPKLKEVTVLEKMTVFFKDSPKMLAFMNRTQKMIHFIEEVNSFPSTILVKLGVQDFGFKILGKVAGQAAVDFVQNSAAILAKEGTFRGIQSIFTGLLSKGAVAAGGSAAGGAAAGAAAGGAAAGAGGLAAAPIPVIGWIIAAVTVLAMALKPLVEKFKNWLKENLNINTSAVKDFFKETLNIGGGGVAVLVGGVVSILTTLPVLIFQMAAMVGPILVFFLIGVFISSNFQQRLVSPLVPPAEMGNCVLKSEYMGNVSCNQSAPENNVPGLKKDNFIRIANSWTAGTNFASACYNDVVNRSLCAGINPAYSLWMWLNESGASNYNRDDIEDFGIHFIPENKNFNAQITKFLTLDPASGCIGDSRIGGNYWLALGANFMNGSDCNPDRPNSIFKSATPRKWLAEFNTYWWEITSDPIPNTIFVPKSGQNCGQESGESTNYIGNAIERTDENGNVWICSETTQATAGGVPVDPNAPGLSGVIVDGECSVGDVVVPTKQCDPQWGQSQLNGGACENGKAGTICSAGCGPTSVSMLMRRVNGSMTPNNVIFSPGSAYANMGCEGSGLNQAQTELSKKFGSGAITYDSTTMGCDEKAIAKWICNGKVVMVLANFYRNSSLNLGGHYVLAVGVKNGKIVVRDPFYDTTETPFDGTKAYGYAHDIKGCLLIDKAAVK